MRIINLGNHILINGDSTDKETLATAIGMGYINCVLTAPPYGNRRQLPDGECIVYTYPKMITNTDTTVAQRFYENLKSMRCVRNWIIFGGNYFTEFLPPNKCWLVWDKMNGDGELLYTSFDDVIKIFPYKWQSDNPQKPVGLLTLLLLRYTYENDVILDGFGGSGSTLIACEQTNRKCIMIEKDIDCCKAIVARYIQYMKGVY